jgi:hypothetical protein
MKMRGQRRSGRIVAWTASILATVAVGGILAVAPALAVPQGEISGTVKEASTPLAGIEVQVYAASTGAEVGAAEVTAANGTYTVTVPGAATYVVGFHDPDGVYADQYYDGEATKAAATEVPVGGGATVSAIDALLARTPLSLIVQSATHPVESVWYSDPDPAFTLTSAKATGFAWLALDHVAATDPGYTDGGTGTVVPFSGIADGLWYFHARALNGTVGGTAVDRAVRIDTTAPVVGITGALPDWQKDDQTLQFTADDAGAGLARQEFKIGDQAWTQGTLGDGDIEQTVSAEGITEVRLKASDTSTPSNVSSEMTATVQIDKTSPVTTLTTDPAGALTGWVNKAVTCTLTASDALSGVNASSYSINGKPVREYTSSFEVPAKDSNGAVAFWSVDKAGNVEVRQTGVHIDTQRPTVRALSNCKVLRRGTAKYRFRYSDALPCGDKGQVVIQLYTLGKRLLRTYAAGKFSRGEDSMYPHRCDLKRSTYYFVVWVRDPALNVCTSPGVGRLTVR